MSFRQGLRFTISYLSLVFILCVCIAAFLYLSNMVAEPLFQLEMEQGLHLRCFGMEAKLSADAWQQLKYGAKALFYFLSPYQRSILKVLLLF